jgi:hypothetical protein
MMSGVRRKRSQSDVERANDRTETGKRSGEKADSIPRNEPVPSSQGRGLPGLDQPSMLVDPALSFLGTGAFFHQGDILLQQQVLS